MTRFERQPESWVRKFRLAGQGMLQAFVCQRSFWVHLPVAAAVIVGAALHNVSRVEWVILIVCITMVLAAELFNTALEYLAQAITNQENEHIRRALDASSGAVLLTSLGAATVGSLILLTRLAQAL